MNLPSINPTQTAAWKSLQQHYSTFQNKHLKDLFNENPARAKDFTIVWEDFYVDFSKNRIDATTKQLLLQLADEVQLKQAIELYFGGEQINQTEKRAVLHTALRLPKETQLNFEGVNVVPEIYEVKDKMKLFCEAIISGSKTGYTNKTFTDVVNIGIGGSDLGPAMVVESLSYYKNHLNTHFVSNVDGDHFKEVIKNLNPETTLFVIVSKTFTTQETLSNATSIREWFLQTAPQEAVEKHFVAVSTNIEKVKGFGIDENNIFPMWDWVGGRFSLWSSVGLSIALSLGFEHFDSLLKGAHKMDEHFKNTDFDENIPVIAALLTVWYNNFFNVQTEAVIPYTQYLNQFATYLQQGIMESNGKCVDRNGDKIEYQTGTIIWGEPGTNSQHAFFQLIHQGTKLIPADFIGFAKSLHGNTDHQDKLMSNFFAQTEALMNGKTEDEARKELKNKGVSSTEIDKLAPFKVFEGNKPTTTIFIDQLTPETLGKLIAHYEHKIFVQGIVWNIFSYDQFGVELGKELANNILKDFANSANLSHDSSTSTLITRYKYNN